MCRVNKASTGCEQIFWNHIILTRGKICASMVLRRTVMHRRGEKMLGKEAVRMMFFENPLIEQKARELERGFYIKRGYIEVLGLGLIEAAVYAIVRSFTVSKAECYVGTRGYIGRIVGCSDVSVGRALSSLEKRGLLEKQTLEHQDRKCRAYVADIVREEELIAEFLDRFWGPYSPCDTTKNTTKNASQNAATSPKKAASPRSDGNPPHRTPHYYTSRYGSKKATDEHKSHGGIKYMNPDCDADTILAKALARTYGDLDDDD